MNLTVLPDIADERTGTCRPTPSLERSDGLLMEGLEHVLPFVKTVFHSDEMGWGSYLSPNWHVPLQHTSRNALSLVRTDMQPCMQVLPDAPVCRLVSLNLLQLEKPIFHIAPYLPSVKASTAPLLFIWHVRRPLHL